MNSVFSAFKSSKSDGSIQSNKVKKLGPANSSSYANLRHIREIGSSAKMSSFVGNHDDDDIAPNLRLTKCTGTLHSAPAINGIVTVPNPITNPNTTTTASSSSSSVSSASPLSSPTSPTLSLTSMSTDIIPQATTKSNTIHQNDIDSNTNSGNSTCSASNHVNSNNVAVSFVAMDAKPAIPSSCTSHHSQSSINYTNIPSHSTSAFDDIDSQNCRTTDTENKENTDTLNPSINSFDSMCANDTSIAAMTMTTATAAAAITITAATTIQSQSITNEKHTPILSAASNKKLNRQAESSATGAAATAATASSKSTSTRFYKRLSLTGISNNPLPSVHGRASNPQNASNSNGNGSGETKRTRISTHQRNLSLDFR